MPARLQPLSALDQAALLDLNNRHERELSALTAGEFARLAGIAFRARGTAEPLSFLLAFDQSAAYASPNFLWFRQRLPRFVYVDRVVVDPAGRGQGLATALYEDLFAAAAAAGHVVVAAEVNSDPPNPASDAFHARLGFVEAGTARLEDRAKSVRYLVRRL